MPTISAVRPKGTGSIIQRGNRWKAQFPISDSVIDGKRVRKFQSKMFDSKPEAEAWLRKQKTDQDEGEWVIPSKLTVAGLLNRWMDVKYPKLAPNTLKEYESVIRNQINREDFGIGKVLIQDLESARIISFYAALRKPGGNLRTKVPAGLSETRIKRVHEVLFEAFRYAVKYNLMVKNPCDLGKDGPKANKAKPKDWKRHQLNLFLAQKDRILEAGPLWHFMSHTGVRLSEALGLLWDDVDLAKCQVEIIRRKVRIKGQREMLELEGTKTKAGTRWISVDAPIVLALKEWKDTHGGPWAKGLVFPFHCDEVDREFTRRVDAAEVPDHGIHCLRHTMATLWIHEMGVSPKTVSERLGHTSVAFTMDQYGQSPDGAQAAAAARFSAFLDAQDALG